LGVKAPAFWAIQSFVGGIGNSRFIGTYITCMQEPAVWVCAGGRWTLVLVKADASAL